VRVFAAAALAGSLVAGAPPKEKVETVLARSAQWVEQFEHDFVTVIADETYDQIVSRQPVGSDRRFIRSELLFMRDGGDTWLAVRNVLSYVDGDRPPIDVVNSRDRLARALDDDRAGGHTALRRLADESARFNIGRTVRNFNNPTLALQFLDDAHRPRFTFRLEGSEAIGTDDAWRLSYDEHAHPTLIKANGVDTELFGHIWVRAKDGAVLRTELRLNASARAGYAGLKTAVTVTYAQDPKLLTAVPVRMEEEYIGSRGETIRGTAVYSNFRVFETSARLIVPQ
jgi:hypothetical protein